MLKQGQCSLVVVDVQDRLWPLMHDKEALLKHIVVLIKSARALDIPILWCQQYPKGLGPTVKEIAELLEVDNKPIDKISFSCYGNDNFVEALKNTGRKNVILCGIETHVCVYQTASHLLEAGYGVELINDAVSSRDQQNKTIALARMAKAGARLSSTEMVLFELMGNAKHPAFKKIAKLIK